MLNKYISLSVCIIMVISLPLHMAIADNAMSKESMSAADIVAKRAREEISRVEHLNQDKLILNPVAIMCSSLESLHQWLYGVIAHHVVDVNGCFKFMNPSGIKVLDYPNILSAHVILNVSEDIPEIGKNREFYTLPSQIIERE